MRFDPTPLYRSTVGFDRLFNLLDNVSALESQQTSFPPYNIARLDEDNYQISMAVAGFEEEELAIEVKENRLTITGEKQTQKPTDTPIEILHHGIAARNFERQFELADHVVVGEANLKNGLLHISLAHVIPEEKKAKKIAISSAQSNVKQIDAEAA